MRIAMVTMALALVSLPIAAWPHETNFGIAPGTVYKRGWQLEYHTTVERGSRLHEGGHVLGDDRRRRREEVETEFEAFYGLREDLTLGLGLPLRSVDERDGGLHQTSEGHGDVMLMGKYRIFKEDAFLASRYLSLVWEYAVDGAPRTTTPALREGGDSFLAGLGYARIDRHWNFWVDGGRREREGHGDGGVFNLATSFRPRVAEINELDFAGLLELNHEREQGPDEGHALWFLSPGIILGRGTTLFKIGFQHPVAQDWNGRQVGIDWRFKVGLEHLF